MSKKVKVILGLIVVFVGVPALIGVIIGVTAGGEGITIEPTPTSEPTAKDCTGATDQASEWKRQVRQQLNFPETYDDGGIFSLSDGIWWELEDQGDGYTRVGYDFEAQNAFGVPLGMRTIGVFTLPPDCVLQEVYVLDGKFADM